MVEPKGAGAAVPARRAADDPGYARLADFKCDLRDMVSAARGGRLPDFRSVANMIGTSPSTAHNALKPDNPTRLSEDTARGLAQAYDPSGLDYWLERRAHLNDSHRRAHQTTADDADAVRINSSAPKTLTPEPAPLRVGSPVNQESGAVRGRLVGIIAGLAIAMGGAIGVPWYLSLNDSDSPPVGSTKEKAPSSVNQSGEPSGQGDVGKESTNGPMAGAGVSDYSDPISADCISDAERVKSKVVESIGLVSIVHSPLCDAYWARAERTDGRELGNHIDISLAAKGSDRSPAVANDSNASVVYTYLLTTKQASAFCVETTFWVGEEAARSAPFCVSGEP